MIDQDKRIQANKIYSAVGGISKANLMQRYIVMIQKKIPSKYVQAYAQLNQQWVVSSFSSCDIWIQNEAVGVSHSETWCLGTISPRVYKLMIENIKNYFSIILISMIISGNNFSDVRSTELSRKCKHVLLNRMITFHNKVTCIFARNRLWAHESLVKWAHGNIWYARLEPLGPKLWAKEVELCCYRLNCSSIDVSVSLIYGYFSWLISYNTEDNYMNLNILWSTTLSIPFNDGLIFAATSLCCYKFSKINELLLHDYCLY